MENRKQNFLEDYFSDFYKNFLMEARSGEPVIVITKRYSFHGCTGFGYEPKPSDYELDTTIWFGVLPESEPFIETLNNGQTLKILTIKRIWWNKYKGLELEIKPITVDLLHTLGKNLSQPLYSPDPRLKQKQMFAEKHEKRKPDLPLEIIVGHEKIQKFLLGLVKYWTEDMYWIDFYLKSIRMANLRDFQLDHKIREYRDRKREIIISQLVRLSETNDLKKIKDLVKEAIDLDMHTIPWTKTLYERPGLYVYVPEFIKGLAKDVMIVLEENKS